MYVRGYLQSSENGRVVTIVFMVFVATFSYMVAVSFIGGGNCKTRIWL